MADERVGIEGCPPWAARDAFLMLVWSTAQAISPQCDPNLSRRFEASTEKGHANQVPLATRLAHLGVMLAGRQPMPMQEFARFPSWIDRYSLGSATAFLCYLTHSGDEFAKACA